MLGRLAAVLGVDLDVLKMHDHSIMHLPGFLKEFVCDPEAFPYIKKAFIEYEYNKLNKQD